MLTPWWILIVCLQNWPFASYYVVVVTFEMTQPLMFCRHLQFWRRKVYISQDVIHPFNLHSDEWFWVCHQLRFFRVWTRKINPEFSGWSKKLFTWPEKKCIANLNFCSRVWNKPGLENSESMVQIKRPIDGPLCTYDTKYALLMSILLEFQR